jgi:glycosyltransferase involved in cell wall biosynthesis
MDSTKPGLSIVLPVYNERHNLELLQKRITEALAPEEIDYEVIYVDDGSTDGSWEVLKSLAAADPCVRLVRFRRNFGQTAAMAAAISYASKPVVVTLDADLQNDPADIPRLVATLGDSYDVVAGWRKNRHDKWLSRRLPSRAANWLIRWMTGTDLHDSGCTLRAYRREIIQDVELYGEMHRFLPMLAAWVGARITEIEVTHHPRIHGKSKYGAFRIYKVFMDLLTLKFIGDFSARPNYVFGGFGIANLVLAGLTFLLVAYRTFVLKNPQATPMIFMMIGFLVTGVVSLFIGLLAEIVIRGFYETQRKAVYYVRETVGLEER